jgi:fructosamine-3-kinase
MTPDTGPWPQIETAIRAAAGDAFRIRRIRPVAGNRVHGAACVSGQGGRFFVKRAAAGHGNDLAAEAAALNELRTGHGLRIPAPIAHGTAGDEAYLVLEYVDMQPLTGEAMARLGEGLAELHGVVRDTFGWDRDNAIGAAPQRNAPHGDWIEFWRENRLGYQLERVARRDPALARAGESLVTGLDRLLDGHRPEASLVHGDLWAGNIAMDADGVPVLFDPAVYFGDRETDLAMSELFGGFSPLFFEAYQGAWPLEPGYREIRRDLYQLYHLLNRFNLLGRPHGGDAKRCIERLQRKL